MLKRGSQGMQEEADRLAALRSYDILDTDTSDEFADFIQIAADVCGTPVALVSLVDETRQWFAAETGLGVRETPIGTSVCSVAIKQTEPLVVADMTADARFRDNPLVSGGPGFRFYGGAQIETADGFRLGTVCVLDGAPRPAGLTPRQVSTLQALARQVMNQLELRRALRQRTEALQRNEGLVSLLESANAEKDAALLLKDTLMTEAHHRVKNSLQTVQSLLTLQARGLGAGSGALQLQEAAKRVRTFGAMHEILYRVGAGAEVDMATYLRDLVQEQASTLPADATGRRLVFEGEETFWPSADVPTVGLILVELMTNALKYGRGTVTVSFRQAAVATLAVRDEGDSLASDFDPAQSRGFGMRIVDGLLRSRRGRLAIDRSKPGTCFVATFDPPTTDMPGQALS